MSSTAALVSDARVGRRRSSSTSSTSGDNVRDMSRSCAAGSAPGFYYGLEILIDSSAASTGSAGTVVTLSGGWAAGVAADEDAASVRD